MVNLSEFILPFHLRESVKSTIDGALREVKAASSVRTTTEELTRIDPKELEELYVRDPVIFNGINLYVKTILSTDFHFACSNNEDKAYMESWSELVNFREILTKQVQHMCIYGNSWNEIRFDESDEIVGVDTLNPKFMDFSRDKKDELTFNKITKEPEFYVQYLEYNAPPQKNEIRQKGMRAIKLDTNIIVQTPMYTVGDNANGIGLIEPIYDTARVKRNIEKGMGQSIYRLGFPLMVGYVGNDKILPNPPADTIKNISQTLSNINERTGLALPHYVKLEILESKISERFNDILNQYVSQEITGMGTPRPYVTGSGEVTNRSVIDKQSIQFERTMRMIYSKIAKLWKKKVFSRIAEYKDFDTVPELVFDDINLESLESKSKRINDYVKSGVVKPDEELEEFVRKSEQLPEKGSEEYQQTPNGRNETGNGKA